MPSRKLNGVKTLARTIWATVRLVGSGTSFAAPVGPPLGRPRPCVRPDRRSCGAGQLGGHRRRVARTGRPRPDRGSVDWRSSVLGRRCRRAGGAGRRGRASRPRSARPRARRPGGRARSAVWPITSTGSATVTPRAGQLVGQRPEPAVLVARAGPPACRGWRPRTPRCRSRPARPAPAATCTSRTVSVGGRGQAGRRRPALGRWRRRSRRPTSTSTHGRPILRGRGPARPGRSGDGGPLAAEGGHP